MQQVDRAAIGGAPAQFGRLVADAAPQAGHIHAKAAQNLGYLPDVAEGVWKVADPHAGTKAAAHPLAHQEVAHHRLRADQELVGQDVPGADGQAPLPDVAADVLLPLRPHLQVVLQHDGLPVEHEVAVVGIGIQQRQKLIHHFDQAKAELLEGQVPLAVPMGM